jgi:hypothetical protein
MFEFLYGMTFALPGLIIPAIVGIYLWRSSTPGTFRRMLALFALKPWLTTPIFVLVVLGTSRYQQWIFPILPGLIVTIILVGTFAALLRARPRTTLLILGGDALRWILATAMLYLTPSYSFVPSGGALMPALVWTSVYALLCWGLAWYDQRQAAAPAAG